MKDESREDEIGFIPRHAASTGAWDLQNHFVPLHVSTKTGQNSMSYYVNAPEELERKHFRSIRLYFSPVNWPKHTLALRFRSGGGLIELISCSTHLPFSCLSQSV
jgi:hypothetical protein